MCTFGGLTHTQTHTLAVQINESDCVFFLRAGENVCQKVRRRAFSTNLASRLCCSGRSADLSRGLPAREPDENSEKIKQRSGGQRNM